jgi:RNA polymerase sigma-70 factor (ECF subfamily)
MEDDELAALASEDGGFSLIEILQLLDPQHRTAVVLHYVEGHRISDIAQMLDAPVGTIKRQLMQARIYLRRVIGTEANSHGGVKV